MKCEGCPMKVCPGCKNEYPATTEFFHGRSASSDGLASRCKNCVSAYSKQYRSENKEKVATGKKQYYTENKEKVAAKKREYYLKNKEKIQENRKVYREKNHEAIRAKEKEYNDNNRDRINELDRKRRSRIRLNALEHYGGECACCGETTVEFLCIDHIGGGGNSHRKKIGLPIYEWLSKNDYPEGFRVLCHNCNMSIGFYGYCPHDKESAQYKNIRKAMIAGKFDCEHCEHGLPFDGEDLQDFVGCGEGEGVRNADEWPCEKWQPRKDDGE